MPSVLGLQNLDCEFYVFRIVTLLLFLIIFKCKKSPTLPINCKKESPTLVVEVQIESFGHQFVGTNRAAVT